jgi:DAK2 domain fusion protein YloV
MTETLDHTAVKRAIASGYANLENRKNSVNNLNVFPVPDGDTGTNMSLTLQYAVKEIESSNAETVGDIVSACSSGALMGARGNSGVILSQLCRGFAASVRGKAVIGIGDIADALMSASDYAYKAVIKPTEGTILTVAREMAEFAAGGVDAHRDIESFGKAVIKAGYEALENTPNLLPVLKEAGVIDAGGQGLMYFIEGMLASVEGKDIDVSESVTVKEPTEFVEGINKEIEYGYCTEFLIRAKPKTHQNQSYQSFLLDKYLKMGDSLLVIEDGGIIKIHIHTNEPWNVMKIAATCGDLLKIKIENMREQHREMFSQELAEQKKSQPHRPYAVVAVSSGKGLSEALTEMGVTHIIEGGQTMNPSTQDFLDVIERANADHFILLPNNKNIILAATQARDMSEKSVVVIPTKTIPEAIGALMSFNENLPPEENEAAMAQGASSVKTGQVTYAVRDTAIHDLKIQSGDILGLLAGEIVTVFKLRGRDGADAF